MSTPKNSIYVSVGVTKKIAQYETLRLDAGTTVVLEEGQDKKEAWVKAWSEVKDELEAQLLEALQTLAAEK